MNPKFIYFDLDDTLLNHRQAQKRALLDVLDHFALFDDIDTDQFVEEYHKINSVQWKLYDEGKISSDELQHNRFTLTLRDFGLDESRGDEIGARYLQFYQDDWQWIDGAESAFKAIRKKFDVGILTNGFTDIQVKKFEYLNLYDLANELIISEKVGVLKPNPGIFEYATKLAGCNPEEILFIGNSYRSDVTGGHNYGWKVGWFTDSDDGEKKQKADFTFNNYKKLIEILSVKE